MLQPKTFDECLREYEARLALTRHGFEQHHVIVAYLPDGYGIVVRGERYLSDRRYAGQGSAIRLEVPNEIAAEALRCALLAVPEPPTPHDFQFSS